MGDDRLHPLRGPTKNTSCVSASRDSVFGFRVIAVSDYRQRCGVGGRVRPARLTQHALVHLWELPDDTIGDLVATSGLADRYARTNRAVENRSFLQAVMNSGAEFRVDGDGYDDCDDAFADHN